MTNSTAGSPFVRAFVAVEVSASVRQALAALQSVLRRAEAHVAWVSPANLHLSMAFLGDTPRDMVQMLALALDEAAATSAPFVCAVKGLGSFGSVRQPRVIWAGVAPCPPLIGLQRQVAGRIRDLGVELEDREYHPHVTLGRVRSPRGVDRLRSAMAESRAQSFGDVAVESVVLMQSRLAAEGAEYTLLHRAALKAKGAAT